MADFSFKSNFNFGATISPVEPPKVQGRLVRRYFHTPLVQGTPLDPGEPAGGHWGWALEDDPMDRTPGIGIGNPNSGGSGGPSRSGGPNLRDPYKPIYPKDQFSECPDIFLPTDEPYKIFEGENGQTSDDWPWIDHCSPGWANKIWNAWNIIFERDPETGRFTSPWANAYSALKDKNNVTLWDCITNTACPEIGCQTCGAIKVLVNDKPTRHYRDGAGYGAGFGNRELSPRAQVLYGICISNIERNAKWYTDRGVKDEQEILIHILLFILILRCNASSTIEESQAKYEALLLSSFKPSYGYGGFPWQAVNRENYYEISTEYRDKKNSEKRTPYLRMWTGSVPDHPSRLKGRWTQWDPDTGEFYRLDGVRIGSNKSWKF